jgi:LysM repeat protein
MVMLFKFVRGFCCLLFFGLVVSLSACSTPPLSLTPILTARPPATLTQYVTQTPTHTPTPPRIPTAAPDLRPTPTPFMHTIVSGDTLLGIALRYRVETELILAANPGIDPNFLTIGTNLVIPLDEDSPLAAPTAAPQPVELVSPVCYQIQTGGEWCFVNVKNTTENAVESITAEIVLYDTSGQPVASRIASTPLNLLPVGENMPLVVFFEEPLPEETFPTVLLLSAFPVSEINSRYISLAELSFSPQITPSGLSAFVSGDIRLEESSEIPASRVRILAVAFDETGQIVGHRLWENTESILPGTSVQFELTVYSLGEKIERVSLLTESRP